MLIHNGGGYVQGSALGGALSGDYLQKQAVPVSVGRVRAAVNSTDKFTEDLAAAINALEDRLSVILRPMAPGVASGNVSQSPELPACHLAGEITSVNGRLIHLAARVREISERVDV